jgi:hypothetical protein
MAGPDIPIEPPVRVKRQGGIEDVATFRSNDRLGNAETIVFQSDGCDFPQISEHLCYTGDADPAAKVFSGIAIDGAIGAPFPLYAGVKCVEGPDPDHDVRAERTLEAGQGRALENELETWAAGGVALTAGATIVPAIAHVEQAIDSQYVGQGVILMSRFNATIAAAAGALEEKDGMLRTKLGTPVIASGSVTAGTIYGLGAIVVEYQEIETREVLDPEYNTRYALAERIFAIAVDCEYRVKSAVTA